MPPSQPRRRSNSLPIPQIEISLYLGSGNSRDSPSNSSLTTKDYIEVPEQPAQAVASDPPLQSQKSLDKGDDTSSTNGGRRPSERKKRVKMADLRTLIETKILSKSDRGLEKIGAEANGSNGKRLQHAVIRVPLPNFFNSKIFSFPFSSRTFIEALTRARIIFPGRRQTCRATNHPIW